VRKLSLAFLLIAVALSAASGYLTAEWLKTSAPRQLTVLGPSDVEIDLPRRDRSLSYTFQLHNPTKEDIRVHKVECGCSCMASKLETPVVQAGQTVPLEIKINTFDAYKPSYVESVRVTTDVGVLDLQIHGRLPLPQQVMYRPQVVYLEQIAGLPVVERVVMVRVPKQCSKEITDGDISLVGCAGVKAEISEDPPSELYREYTIRLTAMVDQLDITTGALRLETGCVSIEVGIRKSSK
jgi:hypothetical protein